MGAQELIESAVAGRTPNARGWIRVTCPFCEWRMGSVDKHASFGLHAGHWWYSCYRCEVKGRLPAPIEDLEAYGFQEAPAAPDVHEAPEGFSLLAQEPAASSMSFDPARRYLERRRVAHKVVEDVGIGACLEGKFGGRIVVPVKDEAGNWLWYVGRAWRRTNQRYKYPQGLRRGAMFNRAALSCQTDLPVYIVEGVFDALPHWPHCVACLGKPQDTQLAAIAGARRPVVLALDGDAHEEAWAIAMRLRLRKLQHGKLGYAHLPPRTDPGDVVQVADLAKYTTWFAHGDDDGDA